MHKPKRMALIMHMVLVVGVVRAFPQALVSTAEIRGQVVDEKGAAIAGATITLTDVTKGTTRQVTSNENGNYVILSLLPSDYTMKVEATGFATKTLTSIHLDVRQAANIPVTLDVGGLQAEVNVTATTDVVEVERSAQASVINERLLNNLPINRRRPPRASCNSGCGSISDRPKQVFHSKGPAGEEKSPAGPSCLVTPCGLGEPLYGQ